LTKFGIYLFFYLIGKKNIHCEVGSCGFGAVCKVSIDTGPICQCEDMCENSGNTVCGSDGMTYENECKLKLASCTKKRHINVLHIGHCGKKFLKKVFGEEILCYKKCPDV